MEKVDCFAYKEKGKYSGCKALKEMNCKNCSFYRNDINEAEIERDIREYAIIHNKQKEVQMNIEKTLKEYKVKKGKIETIQERCKYWQYCLDTMTDDEIAKEFVYEETDTYGMPKAKNNTSPVEKTIIEKEVTREMVKKWIKDDQSRARPLEYEIKQIEIALGSLTEEENYIIECKCIDKWKWRQVEIGFNDRFKTDITEEQLKKKKIEALKKMKEILNN